MINLSLVCLHNQSSKGHIKSLTKHKLRFFLVITAVTDMTQQELVWESSAIIKTRKKHCSLKIWLETNNIIGVFNKKLRMANRQYFLLRFSEQALPFCIVIDLINVFYNFLKIIWYLILSVLIPHLIVLKNKSENNLNIIIIIQNEFKKSIIKAHDSM